MSGSILAITLLKIAASRQSVESLAAFCALPGRACSPNTDNKISLRLIAADG